MVLIIQHPDRSVRKTITEHMTETKKVVQLKIAAKF